MSLAIPFFRCAASRGICNGRWASPLSDRRILYSLKSIFQDRYHRSAFRAFTLIELLTAMAILAVIAALILSIISQTSRVVRVSNDRVESFQSAREGFDTLTRQLSQATLNTYYDYYNSAREVRTSSNSSTFAPSLYGRQSDLHFLSGNGLVPNWDAVTQSIFFQTPMGYTISSSYNGNGKLLNACGFFIAYTSDASEKPTELELAQGGRVSSCGKS